MKIYLKILLCLLLYFVSLNGWSRSPTWNTYAEILKQVNPGVKHGVSLALLDYAQLKQTGHIEAVYQDIKQFPVAELVSREEKLSFYINTYNILAIKMVIDHWPLDSIKDIGNLFSPVWGKTAGIIGGKKVSLDDVENNIIRPMGEPRIHLAIVCASVSCPDIRAEPYRAEKLNAQLEEQARTFLTNDKKGLRIEKNSIQISKVFDWFEKDFVKTGGVEAFIRRYRPNLPPLKIEADMTKFMKKYLLELEDEWVDRRCRLER
jgi:hypothetical protein